MGIATKHTKLAPPAITAQIASIFRPLLTQHYRIKLCYGGRAGGKSYAFADSLLFMGRLKKMCIVCVREVQGSIKDSVHKLLCDRIEFYGLTDYKITDRKIENTITKTIFIFKGLRDQDPQKIKSLEGADIAWIEEAQTITKKSWDILEPTIRKSGSEIWISMNRELETDPIWLAVGANPDDKVWVQQVNYDDNPFCPQEMIDLAEKCKQNNIDDYNHIWRGLPKAQGHMKLIASKDVMQAFEEKMTSSTSPLVIGLDIARFGDDKTVFCWRRGRLCERFMSYEKQDIVSVANLATHFINQHKPYKMFIDIGGLGAGVYDILADRGYKEIVKGIYFGQKALDERKYTNRRAEMWDKINLWLSDVLPVQLPKEESLLIELTAVNKKFDKLGRLQLEDKDVLKRRIGKSSDFADALALTFAEPVLDLGAPSLYGENKVSIESVFKSVSHPISW